MSDFYFKRDAVVKISSEPDATADVTNTIKLRVKDFSWNQTSQSASQSRHTLYTLQDRGSMHYVDSLNPITFNFTTYILPMVDTNVTSPEEYLWLSLMGDPAGISSNSTSSTIDFASGNVSQLHNLTIWVDQPSKTEGNFRLNNAIVDSAEINFDINNIAEIKWSGRALSTTSDNNPPSSIDRGDEVGYLKNKLSTMSVTINTVSYTLILTGGSLTVNNNNSYYSRRQIGKVTAPAGSYTGHRVISGNVKSYFKSGASQSADIWRVINNNIIDDDYESTFLVDATINIGGASAPNVQLVLPAILFDKASINFDEVYSLTVPFKLQEQSGSYMSVIYQMP